MDTIAGYKISNQLANGFKTTVYKALDKNKNPVVLKVLNEEHSNLESIARFNREFEIITSINSEFIIKAIDLLKDGNSHVMVLEDFGGISLKEYIKTQNPATDNAYLIKSLSLSKELALALNDIHSNGIIHKDINSTNILYNSEQNQLKIIDFGLATELSFERIEKRNIHFEGTYAYISPEQTGRINRDIDYRTDYYSLGITLYELFSGNLPFYAETSREWIHSHIAKEAVPLDKIQNNIPRPVSEIVLKLMKKTAEARYQSSYGLIKDLEYCIEKLDKPELLEKFEIGKDDVSQKFQIPQKLYGREIELQKLTTSFRNATKGNPTCVLIKGYSGIGKTSLVGELKQSIIQKKGNFITGKFDQLGRDIPYNALIQALTHLINQLITESQEEIDSWKTKILSEIPTNAKLLIDVIPELELIIGKQDTPPNLPTAETQNRFDIAFQSFFQLFANKEQPLVVFLDDLQWADSASLDMIEKVLKSIEEKPIMLIGAYRDNEINQGHPVLHLADNLLKSEVDFFEIELGPIKSENITHLLQETFKCEIDKAIKLSKLCFEKTQGNPYFLIEFISKLRRNKHIYFEVKQGKWIWDIEQIKKEDVTENVASLVSQRILGLLEHSQEIIKLAACFGSQFNLHSLVKVSNKPWKQVLESLNQPLNESLILPLTENYLYVEFTENLHVVYKFIHDRVQQSSYELLNKDEKISNHIKIGRLLLEKSSEQEIEDNLFTIIGHLNKGINHLKAEEKKLLAEYNLKACRKAKASGAFNLAFNYADNGLKLLKGDDWENNYTLIISLHYEGAETASLIGNYWVMERLLEILFQKARSLFDKAKIHEIRTQSLIARNEQQKAIKETLFLLHLLGIKFPKKIGTHHVLFNLFKTKSLLKKVSADNISNLPKMEDPKALIAMQNMANIISVLYRTDPNLFTLVVFKQIQLTIDFGVAPISPVGFITFGLLVNAVFGNIPRTYELGQLGLKLFDRLNDINYWAQAYYLYNVAINFWKKSLHETNDNLLKAYKVAKESGDFEYMMSSAAARAHYLFRAGSELTELIDSTEKYKHSIAHVYKSITYSQFDVLIEMFTNFVETKKKPEELISERYDERKMIDYHLKGKDETSLFMIHLNKLTLAYYFERYEKAISILKKSKKYLKGVAGLLMFANYHYFEALTLLSNYDNLTPAEKRKARKKVISTLKKFKKWADQAPMNFLGKYKLIEAEKERVSGNITKAQKLYNQAINNSKKNGFIHEEALANELAAKFWIELDNNKIASFYINSAYLLYKNWGAKAKAKTIKEKYSEYMPNPTFINNSQNKLYTSSSTQDMMGIDMETVLEAAKTISGEIVLSDLLKKTIIIILENAGAQKGSLLITDLTTNELIIEAEGELHKGEIQVNIENKNILENNLPIPIIRFVERGKKNLILHNAAYEGDFTSNEYIKRNKVKSAIAIPILKQSKLYGILYLENNLSAYVFTEDRVNILTILCTQIAVSLENAHVYRTLEQKVKERTVEVSKQKEEIQLKAEELKQINKELEILNATKDKLFSVIAHDLKNPFNIIIGYSSFLIDEYSDQMTDEIKVSISSIYKSSSSAYELLQNLLVWSRSQIGGLKCQPQKINLNKILKENFNLYENNVNSKELTLINNVNENQYAFADENMINTVFRNLLSNAIKFTDNGGKVSVSAEEKNNFIEIHIKDTGVGISRDDISKLFRQDIYYSTTGTNKEKGTGLGLILCKDFIEQNGGEIFVESEVGKGSSFTFTLPKIPDN